MSSIAGMVRSARKIPEGPRVSPMLVSTPYFLGISMSLRQTDSGEASIVQSTASAVADGPGGSPVTPGNKGMGQGTRGFLRDLIAWEGPHTVFHTSPDTWEGVNIRGIGAPEMHAYKGKYYLSTVTTHAGAAPAGAFQNPGNLVGVFPVGVFPTGC